MNELVNITFIGLIFGIMGTTLGGIIGSFLEIRNSKYLSFMLEFTAGLMLSIICFELIPESLAIANVTYVILGVILGVICMVVCDNKINASYRYKNLKVGNSNLLKTGIIVGIGLAIHNFPEGLAIGSGFDSSSKLGFALAIAICMHDVPEGISIALPLKQGGVGRLKTILYTMFSGITTGLGALVGAIVGKISVTSISISLAFAAGAMLYIVSGELVPESKKIYKGRFSAIGNIIGFLIGIAAMSI